MKLLHIVLRIDQEAAGPSYSVPRLCQALAARGHEVDLFNRWLPDAGDGKAGGWQGGVADAFGAAP